MNKNSDPEETQLAPTELAVENQPTVPARGNEPTRLVVPQVPGVLPVSDLQHLAERVDRLAYWQGLLENRVLYPQGQPEQEAKQINETARLQAALGAAGSGLFFTMSATMSIPKEVIIGLALGILLLLALWAYHHYGFKSAPTLT